MAKYNILNYAKDNLKSFEECPFNSVDSLLLCQLFYGRIEAQINDIGLNEIWTVKDLNKAEYFGEMFFDDISDEENKETLTVLSASPRFRDVVVKNLIVEFSEKREMQFAAVTYEISDDVDYVCFRGTDGTILGWKEDFNMAFMPETPSQANAVRYLKIFYGDNDTKKLYVGGHSKGGNLAVYGASLSDDDIQERIIQIFSHDGPGFRDEFFERAGYYNIKDRIYKMVPQTSAIGMLLTTQEEYKVVKSSTYNIIDQHSAFTWNVNDCDFEYLKERSREGEYIDKTMHDWLMSASLKEREIFVDAVFKIFTENGIDTIKDANAISARDAVELISSLDELNEESKKIVYGMIKTLIVTAVRGRKDSALKRIELDKRSFENILTEINSGIFNK